MASDDAQRIRAAINQIDATMLALAATREVLVAQLIPFQTESVSFAALKEFAENRGMRSTVASRLWHLLHGRIKDELLVEHGIELEVYYEGVLRGVLNAQVVVGSLKRLRPYLVPGMTMGYGEGFDMLLKEWIDSL